MLTCCKYIAVLYNFVFWLTGVAIVGLSAYVWWDSGKFLDLNDVGQEYVLIFIVLVILGGIMMIVGFLGCCGAFRESSCLLGIYFLLCITMCVACGASLFWVIKNENVVREKLKKDATVLMTDKYGLGHTNATEMLVDNLQRRLECCGVNGPQDWINSSYNRGNKTSGLDLGIIGTGNPTKSFRIPPSCCKESTTNCYQITNEIFTPGVLGSLTGFYHEGCIDKFDKLLQDKWYWLVAIGGIVIATQIFALFFACVLCCAISRGDEK